MRPEVVRVDGSGADAVRGRVVWAPVLRWLHSAGLVWNIGLPPREAEREDLARAA